MAEFASFNPTGAFQTARGNALTLAGRQDTLAETRANLPLRNELNQLGLAGARVTAGREQRLDQQAQAITRAKILGQAAEALIGVPFEQRGAALQAIEPHLARFGIEPGSVPADRLTDDNLMQAIAAARSITGGPPRAGFTLGPGQERFDAAGNPIAQVAPKVTGFQLDPGEQRFEGGKVVATGTALPPVTTPPALLKGLPPELSDRADAAFVAAGGGAAGIRALNASRVLFDTERKETLRINIKRIGKLEQSSRGRAAEIVKARKFLKAFEAGTAQSGTTRTALSFVPGVFTDQAQFDQELDSFAETAARAKLKALGEIRPTDADVKGMKSSLFGIGRDEPTNIQLLTDFVNEQEALNDELDALRSAKKANLLDSFVGGAPGAPAPAPAAPVPVQEGTTAVNTQTGQRIVFRNGNWQPIQ